MVTPNRSPLSLAAVYRFYYPLAMSGLIMAAGQPIVHAGLARMEAPDVTLAAHGLAYYVAMLLESPVIMVLPMANALVWDERSYALTRNCALAISTGLTALTALVALWGGLYHALFVTALGFPAAVAHAARPELILLIPWPAVIGLRRFYQGVLIHYGRTHAVGFGTCSRLVSMGAVLWAGGVLFPGHGILVAGSAMMAGVTADAVVALVAARRLLLGGALPALDPETPAAGLSVTAFGRFFLPLSLTSALLFLSRPLVLSGIARGHEATLALAAWPVAHATMHLVTGHLQMLQQAVVALGRDRASLGTVRRFSLITSGVCVALLLLLAYTPLAGLYHRQVIGLRGPALAMTNAAVRLLVLMPLLVALQAFNQGLLIRGGLTLRVNAASFANLAFLVGSIHLLAVHTRVPGHLLAATLVPAGLLLEGALLGAWSRPVARELARAAAGSARAR